MSGEMPMCLLTGLVLKLRCVYLHRQRVSLLVGNTCVAVCVTARSHAASLSKDWVFARGRTVVITENSGILLYLLLP